MLVGDEIGLRSRRILMKGDPTKARAYVAGELIPDFLFHLEDKCVFNCDFVLRSLEKSIKITKNGGSQESAINQQLPVFLLA